MNKSEQTGETGETGDSLPTASGKPAKHWEKPVLTRYGRMADLTLPGGGPNSNDGDYIVGSPLVPTS